MHYIDEFLLHNKAYRIHNNHALISYKAVFELIFRQFKSNAVHFYAHAYALAATSNWFKFLKTDSV